MNLYNIFDYFLILYKATIKILKLLISYLNEYAKYIYIVIILFYKNN